MVATRGPSDSLVACLESFVSQQLPNSEILVVGSDLGDDATVEELARVVHAVAPDADVVVAEESGISAAFNVVLENPIAAPYLLFLSDDTALHDDAVAHLIAESGASNAAIVGPKLVEWERPRVLVEVGLGADKFAHPVSAIEADELDQEQHDAVADVFAVPSSCMLVRTELFERVGGFDPAIPTEGEDIDFCWRSLLAGARIVVAPDAVARQQVGASTRWSAEPAERLRPRHQVRTVLGGYGRVRLARVVPQMLALWTVEILGLAATLQFGRIRNLIRAWTWNLRRLRSANKKRGALEELRVIHDGELRDYQERGSAKVARFFSTHFVNDEGDSSIAAARQSLASKLATGELRNALVVLGAVAAVVLFGSRQLLGSVPAFGEFTSFGDPRLLLSEWWSGWWRSGLGSDAAVPTGQAGFGVLGYASFGATGFLRQVCILGLLPVGLAGMWRLTGALHSRRAQAVAVLVYACVPVPYNGLAAGSWSTLAIYAALPWILNLAVRVAGDAPFPRTMAKSANIRAVGRIGLVVGIAGWITPLVVPAALLVLAGIIIGSLIVGSMRGIARLTIITVAGVALGVALHLPSALALLREGVQWAPIGGAGDTEPGVISLLSLVRFHTGPFSDTPLVWALLVPAAAALLIGRGWRLVWAVRSWFVMLTGWAVAWAAEWGSLPVPLPAIELPLTVAALGLALAAALAVSAVEHDLGRNRFGWRQVAAVASAAALLVGSLPLLAASFDGGWHSPDQGFDQVYGQIFDEAAADASTRPETDGEAVDGDAIDAEPTVDVPIDSPIDQGDYRVLWIGDPEILPVEGWPLAGQTAFALTESGIPTLADRSVAPLDDDTERVRLAIEAAASRRSGRLGSALAPMGVRYLVVVVADAPAPYATRSGAIDPAVAEGLAEQLDLVRLGAINRSIQLYENQSWFPTRATIPIGSDVVPESGSTNPVLTERTSANRFSGPYTPGTDVHVATANDPSWRLEVAGRPAARSLGFGWANQFTPNEQGDAVLFYRTPTARRAALVAQLAAWLFLLLAMWVRRWPSASPGSPTESDAATVEETQ